MYIWTLLTTPSIPFSIQIVERRNLNRIARDLDDLFEDATEMDLDKASAGCDFCCICMGAMSVGNVKKVGCGHLFHTHCLREVVERARSIETARCPLCRAHVLDGQPDTPTHGENNNNTARDMGGNNNNNNGPNEHALFRFSTERFVPSWLPLPAFSFEVVRRPPMDFVMDNNNNNNNNDVDGTANTTTNNNNNMDRRPANETDQRQQQQLVNENNLPWWRRVLSVLVPPPLTPEEEQVALAQLVDMFPQHDRADLLRELRARGSSEGVVDAILAGAFTGVPRGSEGDNDDPNEGDEQQQQGDDTNSNQDAMQQTNPEPETERTGLRRRHGGAGDEIGRNDHERPQREGRMFFT